MSEFFIWQLPTTIEANAPSYIKVYATKAYVEAICTAAKDPRGSSELRKNLTELYNFPEDWRDLIIAGLVSLKETDPKFYQDVVASRDEIPF